jgi:phage baseplate assembly protein gpV
MDGFPKLVQVLDSPRLGTLAVFSDGMVAQYDHAVGIWRPAPSHISYEALFCTQRVRATDTLDLTLAPDIAVED